MNVLLDLDGTLTHTADAAFKPFKDGVQETVVSAVPPFSGAKQFIEQLKSLGHNPIIISDSHPRYVKPIAEQLFSIQALSLADKPNTKKTIEFLQQQGLDINDKKNFILIGDTYLDIELGRALGYRTVLTNFYKATTIEERDGIGKTWNHLKSGPTHLVKKFDEIIELISNPLSNLWEVEAVMQGSASSKAIPLNYIQTPEGWYTIFRSLGRQEAGECDDYGVARYYVEFQEAWRTADTLNKLAHAVKIFLEHVVKVFPEVKWDFFTFVSDKATTKPPDKMKKFFELIDFPISKEQLLKWNDSVDSSIRNYASYRERRSFIAENLKVIEGKDLRGKSVIVIDDQFTSGGTAYEVVNILRNRGATHVLFVTLFFMVSTVMSSKHCPRCNKPMQIKIRKIDGNRFYSCTPPQFKGTGCGYAENYV